MVYTLGFQRLKERAFSSSLKTSRKDTSHQTKRGTGGAASGENALQESILSWWPGLFSHPCEHETAEGPPQGSPR